MALEAPWMKYEQSGAWSGGSVEESFECHGEMLPVWKGERTQSRHKQSHVRIHTDAKGHDVF